MSIQKNLKNIQALCKKAGREDIRLVAVSKKQSQEKIIEALQAGQRVFGENRVQEALEHWENIRGGYPDLELHLIGPLQTNKVKDAVALFDVIQTLDREKLAVALGDEMKKHNRFLPCFIQVNTGMEEQKSGVIPENLSGFLKFCRKECGLAITGLMCIPPVDEPPALHFALLKKLAGENDLKNLSMGMSGDFEKALKLGATHIRLGTAIFGERNSA